MQFVDGLLEEGSERNLVGRRLNVTGLGSSPCRLCWRLGLKLAAVDLVHVVKQGAEDFVAAFTAEGA